MSSTLLYLQIIVQVQNQLSSNDSPTNMLKKPDHILSFIKHALDSATSDHSLSSNADKPPQRKGLGLDDLRIVDKEEEELPDNEADSDDEDSPGDTIDSPKDDDMTATALNLLLSVLEGTSNDSSCAHQLNCLGSQSGTLL